MAKRRKSAIPGFSARRALGISSAQARISRRIGIPLSKSGRRNKANKALANAYLWMFLFCAFAFVYLVDKIFGR